MSLPHGGRLGAMARQVRAQGNRIWSFVDQGLQGVSNVVVSVILARALDITSFASIGLMIGIYYFIFSVHRVSVVLPFILDASEEEASPEIARDWWTASLVVTAGVEVLLAIAWGISREWAALHPETAWVAASLGWLLLILPLLLAGEFGRRVFFQEGKARAAAIASVAYCAAGLAVALVALWTGSALVGALAFAASGLGSTLVFLVVARPKVTSVAAAWSRWRPHAAFSLWQSLTSVLFVLYGASAVILVATFADAVAAGVYTAARTLVNPALSIVSAVDSLDKPRAARAIVQGGIPGLRGSIGRTRRLLLLLSGTYLGLVAIFAPWLLHNLLGSTYADHADAVRVLAFGFLLMCLNQPSETMLVVLRMPRLLFVVRLLAVVLAVAGIWFGAQRAGVMGTALALAAVQLFALVALQIAERVGARQWQAARPASPAPDAGGDA